MAGHDARRPRVQVLLPDELARLFAGCERRVEVEATTVGEMITALNGRWPGLRDRLCEPSPRLRRNINVFVAGRRADLETCLDDGAEVTVMRAVTG